uniref:Uncharacterized protein n=1 Tax=Pipistrellus kuhlii TaxID=59472 RepID=A0A7J7ZJ59_PIPKU|nr:hypothetical protein mPipKuh1_009428 [Pipistrellus kuhlii]
MVKGQRAVSLPTRGRLPAWPPFSQINSFPVSLFILVCGLLQKPDPEWALNHAGRVKGSHKEEDYLKRHRLIYQQIIQTYLTVGKDVVMVGLGDGKFQIQLLHWSLRIMHTVKGFFYVSLLLGILKEVTESSLKQKTDSDEEVATLFDMIQKVFQKMLECMAWSFKKKPEEGLRVSDVEDLSPPEYLSDLPPFSRCLIGIIIKSPNVVRSFLDELKMCVTSDDIEGIVCLTAVMHIILVINKGKHKSSRVKDVAAAVHRKLQTFMEITLEEDSRERFLYESSSRTLGAFLNS